MKRNRLIMVGIGRIGSELLRRLPKDYDLLCIDNAPDAEERAKKLRGDGTAVMRADATSRLVLQEASVDDAEAVLITTTSETVNIEVARLLRDHFHPKRVIAVGSSSEGIKQLLELGTEVQELFASGAAGIRNMLEHRARTATTIGLGKNEILEVEVHPHSRLANKPLRNLAPIRWTIGLIYREGNILLPRGDTVLRPKDRVVILGDPPVLKTVAEIMTFNFQKFPLEYGTTAIICLSDREDESFFAELEYFFGIFPLQRAVFVRSGRAGDFTAEYGKLVERGRFRSVEERRIDMPLHRAVKQVLDEDLMECGVIVISGKALARRVGPAIRKRQLREIVFSAACPVLLVRGTHPYVRTAVPGADGMSPHHALETALELASSLNNEVAALLVKPVRYLASADEFNGYDAMRRAVSELGLMYRTSIISRELEGNPVRAVLDALPDYNLLCLDLTNFSLQRWPLSLLNPDVVWHIFRRSAISTLLVPPVEESL
jgi:Trk K+ transport system NAD-binding subunit